MLMLVPGDGMAARLVAEKTAAIDLTRSTTAALGL